MMDALLLDLRYGVRQLLRARGFTLAAVATLTFGIGANTALFTLGRAILSAPLTGVMQSDRLVWVMATRRNGSPTGMSYLDYQDYRAGLKDQVDLAAVADGDLSISSGGEPARVSGQIVTGNYFTVLGTPFALGRGFLPREDSVGKPVPVAVITYSLWEQRFNHDSSIVGKSIIVNGRALTVVGVADRGFNGADLEIPRGVYLPLALHDVARPEYAGDLAERGAWFLKPIGRLAPGVTADRLAPAARTIASRIATEDSARHGGISARVYSAKSGMPPGSEQEVTPVTILSAVVTGLVLLIACANVSNLLLARAVSRRREVGIRLSIGATRSRLVRQLLTESLLLALTASAAGLVLAYWSTDWLLASGVLPLSLDVRPDLTVIAFATVAATGAAILFGLVPAIEATRSNLAGSMKAGGGQGRDPHRSRLQSTFVVTQLALSLVLLTTSGLFLRSMYKARNVEVGFQASSQVLGVSFDLGLQGYDDARAGRFVDAIRDRALGMPGVQAATVTDVPPMGNRYVVTEISLEGQRDDSRRAGDDARASVVNQSTVLPGYFSVLGMHVVAGRDFTQSDNPSSMPVVVVSDATARALWPGKNAIGQRLSLQGDTGPMLTVVGVVSDVLLGGPTENKYATAYVPLRQHPGTKHLTMLVRTSGDPGALADGLRRAFRALDANLPLFHVQTLAQYKEIKLADRMNGAAILAGFGALALLLASIGVYGVMAFAVAQRTREIGIRIALGARPADVVRLFVSRGMRITALGVAIGLVLSLGTSRLLQGLLFGLTATDGATLAGVALTLASIALLASWLPSRRAAGVDPLSALRSE